MHSAGRAREAPQLPGTARQLFLSHCTPVRLSRRLCSCQFGRASAPMMPQPVQTMRGPKDGTGTSSGHVSTESNAERWHNRQLIDSERTPCARMLPSVIAGPAYRLLGIGDSYPCPGLDRKTLIIG
jgi:hypothetical protein